MNDWLKEAKWQYIKDGWPNHLDLCLIYLERNNSYDELGMTHYYVGRFKKDQCNTFDKGKPVPEYIESYFDTYGGTVYHIDVNRVTKYIVIEEREFPVIPGHMCDGIDVGDPNNCPVCNQ